jgi:hypothetical protein
MSRLPIPGSDDGGWGTILNDYLAQAHTAAGAIKTDAVTTGAVQNNAVTAAKLSATGGSSGQALVLDTAASGGLSWQTVSGGSSAVDASAGTKGIVKLAGDLGGTADLPTVPGLAGKAALSHTHAIADVTGLQTALDAKANATAVGNKIMVYNAYSDAPALAANTVVVSITGS